MFLTWQSFGAKAGHNPATARAWSALGLDPGGQVACQGDPLG